MKQHNNILDKVNRNDGIVIPEGYIEAFTAKMETSLPIRKSPAHVKPTLWIRLKPYVYMAAMFAGIFCMMKMFDMMRSNSADLNIENYPALTATLESSDEPIEIIDDLNQYEILDDIYNEGFTAEDIFLEEDSLDIDQNQGDYILP